MVEAWTIISATGSLPCLLLLFPDTGLHQDNIDPSNMYPNMYVLNVWKLTTGLRDSFIYANVPDFPNLYGCVHGRTPKAPPKIPSKHLTLKK